MSAHRRWREGRKRQHESPPLPAVSPDPPPPVVPVPVQARDIPGVAWWALEQVAAGALDARDGSVYSTLLRVLLACAPADADVGDVLAEVELRGRLMHGLTPASPGQWELFERRFSGDAAAEVQRWARLFEADSLDVVDPAFLRDG